MEIPWSIEEMLSGIESLIALEPAGTQYVRPIAYRKPPELWVTGAEGRPVDVSIFTVRTDAVRDLDAPIACHISPIERISSCAIPGQIKVSGAYVNSLHARRTAERSGFADGIMLDRQGRVAEASAANIFFIEGETLITPPANPDVFPGVTRRVVMEVAKNIGIRVRELDIVPGDLERMEGAFLCSTLMEIRALSQLGGLSLNTIELPIFNAIRDEFRALTHK
jgi:branched-chain amino acid aminotransferase